MDAYDDSSRRSASEEPAQRLPRSTRQRDDYRPNDTYRDRRRSPDRRRDRRRSRSPANIDRYQPDRSSRDEYRPPREYDEPRRRRSSPERTHGAIDRYVPGQDPPAPLVNPLPDPMKLDIQVGYTWFAEWWRFEQRIKEDKERAKGGRPPRVRGERESREDKDVEKPKIQAAYDQYKENLHKAQAQTFVRLHKDEDWFRERYVPEVRDAFRSNLAEFRKGLYAQFEIDLADGLFDDFTLEGIYKTESNGQGGVLEKEEGETVAAAEVLQTGDLLPSLGGDMRDSMSLQPTLLLKTIAPTVTRSKLEQFAKELLGTDPGGIRHVSLSDPNPARKCHRMGWIILKQDPDESNDQTIPESLEEGEASMTDARASTAERALAKIDGKTIEDAERGNFTVHCGIHRPPDAPRKKALWDLFSAPERITKDLELATRLVRKFDNDLGDECFGVAKIEERVDYLHGTRKLQPSTPAKPIKDFDIMEEGEEEDAIDEDEVDDDDLLVHKKKLDLLVEYLRRVYNFCFFCVFESDSVHELQRKCPGGHLRRPRASLTSAAKDIARASASGEPFPSKAGGKVIGKNNEVDDGEDLMAPESPVEESNKFSKPSGKNALQLQRAFNWVKTYEEKVLQLLEPENVDLKKAGGVPVEEGMEEEMKKFVQQEDANKYRCMVPGCTKLFKGVDFWRKHVKTRHSDFDESVRRDVELVNTYVLDPSHIAPSRSDANSNGHFPIGNSGAPTGTPRGFSLQSHMPLSFSSGMGGGYSGMPWGPPGSVTNPITHIMPGIGPVRSNGRSFTGSYRGTGPYTRPDARNGRMPSFSGRGEGGASAIGPREATQGRTVRSYEDLDAAATTNTEAELDY